MLFFFGTATQKFAREKLLAAENELIRFARKQYAGTDGARAETYDISTIDTIIPASSVPLSGLTEEELVMHGILVVSSPFDSDNEKYRNSITSEISPKTTASSSNKLSNYPLVILHGYMNSSLNFYRNWVGLTKYFDKIISLDLLGFGLSSRPTFSLPSSEESSVKLAEDVFVKSLEEWRKVQGIDKMVLAGHSMGGYLSVAYCERYPERVDRLILISPVGVPEEDDARKQSRKNYSFLRSFVSTLFDWNWTPGTILRITPEKWGRDKVYKYIERRLPSVTELDERNALADYLYYNNTLPGSGEYALQKLLTPFAYAKEPLLHRIPKLLRKSEGCIKHISFLYGRHDWMDSNAALEVKELCSNSILTSSGVQSGFDKDGAVTDASRISVYQVQNAGHLLMLDNWKAFDTAIALAMGGSVSTSDTRRLDRVEK